LRCSAISLNAKINSLFAMVTTTLQVFSFRARPYAGR